MKTSLIYLMLFLSTSLAAPQAQAWEHFHHWHYMHHPYYGHRYWNHGWHYGRFGWWLVDGAMWSYYSSPVYDQTTYIVEEPVVVSPAPAPAPTQVIVAPAATPPTVQSGANSYYCAASQSYYPAIKDCPEGWVVTPAAPPPH